MRDNLGNRESIGKDRKKTVWTFKALQTVWYAWESWCWWKGGDRMIGEGS